MRRKSYRSFAHFFVHISVKYWQACQHPRQGTPHAQIWWVLALSLRLSCSMALEWHVLCTS